VIQTAGRKPRRFPLRGVSAQVGLGAALDGSRRLETNSARGQYPSEALVLIGLLAVGVRFERRPDEPMPRESTEN
jgi:hypothetical protein